MHLRNISYAFKAAADVARAGQLLVASLDRSQNPLGSILIGVGLGVGIGALLFSETARHRVRTWLGATVQPKVAKNGSASAPFAAAKDHEA